MLLSVIIVIIFMPWYKANKTIRHVEVRCISTNSFLGDDV